MGALSFPTSRFGTVEVDDGEVVRFPRGLIGLGGEQFALLGPEEDTIRWLHAVDDPDLAVPVANPWAFFPDYAVELSDEEAERIGVTDPATAQVLVVVRADEDPGRISANLLAPILVSAGVGHQVMNEASWAPLREPLLSGGRRQVAA